MSKFANFSSLKFKSSSELKLNEINWFSSNFFCCVNFYFDNHILVFKGEVNSNLKSILSSSLSSFFKICLFWFYFESRVYIEMNERAFIALSCCSFYSASISMTKGNSLFSASILYLICLIFWTLNCSLSVL